MNEHVHQTSTEDKQEAAFQRVLNRKDPFGNDMPFRSAQAKARYEANVIRVKDAIQLKKEPDRVPVTIFANTFPLTYAGVTPQEAMYDYDKCIAAFRKFNLDFDPDFQMGAVVIGPGRFFDLLDYKLFAWPGHGVSPTRPPQAIEKEYMSADEYDQLIEDPSFFFRSVYLPRVVGAFEPLSMLPPLTNILEMHGLAYQFIPYAFPQIHDAYKKIFEAGAEALKWAEKMIAFDGEMAALGYPNIMCGFTKAPFDAIGDTLRGTKGIMMDMFRQPHKLIQAMEAITPLMIHMGVSAAQNSGNPIVFMPLHKGADGFLSDEQYRKFYWPTLKQVILGLIDEGCIPFPAAEGAYNTRLDIIKDIPRGKTLWMFDQTDMVKAKKIVGDTLCIFGNVPSSLLNFGTVDDVGQYVKKLIETVGKGGGFILSNGAFFDHAKPENVKAMIDFTREYGGGNRS